MRTGGGGGGGGRGRGGRGGGRHVIMSLQYMCMFHFFYKVAKPQLVCVKEDLVAIVPLHLVGSHPH